MFALFIFYVKYQSPLLWRRGIQKYYYYYDLMLTYSSVMDCSIQEYINNGSAYWCKRKSKILQQVKVIQTIWS